MTGTFVGKKMLIIMPKFPWPVTGACEQDRFQGVHLLQQLGFTIIVIAKARLGSSIWDKVSMIEQELGCVIKLIPYREKRNWSDMGWRLFQPWYWDGAAYEYTDPAIRETVREVCQEWKPDLVWGDYTFLWPLYRIVRKFKIPIITRSINFEPRHFLEEEGWSIFNIVKAFGKLWSEYLSGYYSTAFFAITPFEATIYQWLGLKEVKILPLRGLPRVIKARRPDTNRPTVKTATDVVFMGSTYNVPHNEEALRFILMDIIPAAMLTKAKKPWRFHILGAKFPDHLRVYLNEAVTYEGFVENLDDFLGAMDIALIPSMFGAGMQQKVFEPLARGLATITSPRALVGYPFTPGQDVRTAVTALDFAQVLYELSENESERLKIATAAANLSSSLFSESVILQELQRVISNVLSK